MMNQRRGRRMRSVLLVLTAGALLGLPTLARGQDANEMRARQEWQRLYDKTDYFNAERYARQAIGQADSRKDAKSVFFWQNRLGHSLMAHGALPEAEDVFKSALESSLKLYGTDSAEAAVSYGDLGRLYKARGMLVPAEGNLKRALEIRERLSLTKDNDYRFVLDELVDLYVMQMSRPADALPLAVRLLALSEATEKPEGDIVARALLMLGVTNQNLGRPAEADAPLKRALAIYTKRHGPEHEFTLATIVHLANGAVSLGRVDQADALFRQVLAVREKVNGPEGAGTAECLLQLSTIRMLQANFRESEAFSRRAAAAAEKAEGPDSLTLATALHNLSFSCLNQLKLDAAEQPLRRALAIYEKVLEPDNVLVGSCVRNLGTLYLQLARYAEAEPLLKRALAIHEKASGPASAEVADDVISLGSLFTKLGRFSEAEPLFRRGLEIRRKVPGPNQLALSVALVALANWAEEQRRVDEARAFYQQAIAILEKIKPEYPFLSLYRGKLAGLGDSRVKPEERLASLRKDVAVAEKQLGSSHPAIAYPLNALAKALYDRGEYAEAAEHYRRSLKLVERAFGPNHIEVANVLKPLADCDLKLGKLDEGESMAERAVVLLDHLGASPQARAEAYQLRALFAWNAKRRTEAMADMEKALDLIELARTQASGTGVEKAAFFGAFDLMYENMVVLQSEADDPSGVLRAIERSHARSLLEELSIAGTDLDLGRPAEERDRLRARERELTAAIAGLEKRIADGAKDPGLAGELAASRDRLYDHHREARASSPVYQGLITTSGGPVRLSTLQRKLLQNFGVLVVYYIGPNYSCVVVAGAEAKFVVKLELDEATARTLGVEPGALSAAKLRDALINSKGTGVVQMLADRVKSKEATPKLAALWKLLIPDALKKSLVTRETKRLIIVPDGPLAILPFEALVVEPGEDPKYLLDIGPPITYCPSASVLSNLVDRPYRRAASEAVLTVGDPSYSGDQPALAVAANESKTRFGAGGGRLPRLPFTAREVEWVVKGIEENKLKSVSLLGANATEAAVRAAVPGRRFVHLACHGLTDPEHGNFFGSLALTPGPKAANDPENDGFLTLTEIYRLNLGACEVGILSACNTNFGPQQKGEGTWAVSRGFLVAGARRVVASNWLVDDESAASLISLFLTEATKLRTVPPPADAPKGTAPKLSYTYPSICLLKAKRWVRQQEAWKAPYYWASFVQIGPP